MSSLRLITAALAAATTAFAPALAEAGGFHVHVHGHFHIGGAVSIGAADVSYGGGGYVGGYVEEAPPPPPAPIDPYDDSCACQQPTVIQPQPVEPAYYPPTPVVYASPHRLHIPFGVGLYASALTVAHSDAKAEGTGAVLRMRLGDTVELEGEIAQNRYQGSDREDTSVGGSLYLNLAHRASFVPYLVIGGGANVIGTQSTNAMNDSPAQGYVEGGAGVALRLASWFTISADARIEELQLAHDQQGIYHTATAMGVDEKQQITTVRLAGILYF